MFQNEVMRQNNKNLMKTARNNIFIDKKTKTTRFYSFKKSRNYFAIHKTRGV